MTSALLHKFRSELDGNLRLRLGIWAILGILVFFFIGVLHDKNDLLQRKYVVLNKKHVRLETLARENWWQQRADELQLQVKDRLKRIPMVKNSGLAKAKVENLFSGILKKNSIKSSRLDIERIDPVKGFPGVYQVITTIKGRFEIQSFFEMLYQLETLNQDGNVLVLQVVRGKSSRFNLTYALYYRIEGN